MKVTVDGVEILNLSEIDEKIIKHEILSEVFEEDMIRRLKYVATRKYELAFEKLKKDWDPQLEAAGVESIPTDNDAYARLVFSQPGYKNKDAR